MASTFDEQARQTFENVKSIVEAAGLTMEHVVYSQVYLENTANYDSMNKIWAQYFSRGIPPARATVGVYKMPTDTPIEVNAMAVRELSRKKAIGPRGSFSAGVMAGDRLYLSGFFGAEAQQALDQMGATLSAAGMDFRHVVFVNPYLTKAVATDAMNRVYAKHFEFGNTPARATIQVNSLPNGANIEFTGVAIRDLSKRRAVRPKNMPPSPTASPCVFADDTLFCSAKSGFIPGPNGGIFADDVENQVRQTMRNLLDNLEEAGMDFSQVVATNVYLDNLTDAPNFNEVYGQYLGPIMPASTMIQQIAPAERKADQNDHYPDLEQVSLIAVRRSAH